MANPITKILTNVVDTLGNKIGALPSTSKSIADYSDIINQGVRLDTADAYKNLFHVDTEFAKGYGGELKSGSLKYGSDDMPPSLTDKELIDAQNEIKGLTQDYLKDLPDDLTVYRYGGLDNETGVSSFTLNPNYNVDSSLPWQKRLQSPMQTFKVKKEDVLASPDINAFFGGGRGFDEQEVIIGNDKVGALPSSNFNDLRKGATIRIDNPPFLDAITNETYVAKKIRENNEFKKLNPSDDPIGTVSGVTGFANNVKFSPQELIGIKGHAGEEKYRESGRRMELLKESIAKEGYRDADKGGERILIHVREDGVPFITEGNHRMVEAFQSNRPFISADVRYLRGAEEVDGLLNPKRIGLDFGEE
jgi:hypothetical protein